MPAWRIVLLLNILVQLNSIFRHRGQVRQ